MLFENPNMMWMLLFLLPTLSLLFFYERRNNNKINALFPSIIKSMRKKQLEKCFVAGVLLILLTFILSSPKVAYILPVEEQKSGEILLLVDVSRSMAAQTEPDIHCSLWNS